MFLFLRRYHSNLWGPVYYWKLCLSEIFIIFIFIFNERYSICIFHLLKLRIRDLWNVCTILYWWLQIKLIYWSHIFILKWRFFNLFIFIFLFWDLFQMLYFLFNFWFLFLKTLDSFFTIYLLIFILWTFWFFIAALVFNLNFLLFFEFWKKTIILRRCQ